MGVLGHDLAAATPTDPWILAAGVAFATLVARPLAPLRIGAVSMLVGLAVVQAAVHLACIAAIDGGAAATAAHAHMVSPGGDVTAGGWPMLLAHAVSLLLGAAVLLTLERHAWGLVRGVATRIAAAVRRAPRRSPRPARRRLHVRRAYRTRVAACRRHGAAHGTRGPPRRVALPA